MSTPRGHFEILGKNRQKREKQQGSTLCAKKYFGNRGSPKIAGMQIFLPENIF